MSDSVELHRVINIVLRRWWVSVLVIAVFVILGYSITQRQTPVYEATASVMVGQLSAANNLSREDIQLNELFAQTYADLAVRQPVLQGVVDTLGLNESWQELRKRVQVSYVEGTRLIEIDVEDKSPGSARTVADAVADHLVLIGSTNTSESEEDPIQVFINQQMTDIQAKIVNGKNRIREIDNTIAGAISSARLLALQTEKANLERLIADHIMNYVALSGMAKQQNQPNVLNVIERAHSSNEPVRPNLYLNLLVSAGLGMFLGIGAIFVWDYLDDVVMSTDDLSQISEMNILGTVGRMNGRKDLEITNSPLEFNSSVMESYRRISNKIRFASGDSLPLSIVVTSPVPDEGKSITAANLGIIMAQTNLRTILVDANFTQPVLHQLFDAKNESGLAELIELKEINIPEYLKDTPISNLKIITSGEISQDQNIRLRPESITEILLCLEEYADVIIIDSPPAMLNADAALLSNTAGQAILVVRAAKSKRRDVKQTLIDLQEADANLLGCIVIRS